MWTSPTKLRGPSLPSQGSCGLRSAKLKVTPGYPSSSCPLGTPLPPAHWVPPSLLPLGTPESLHPTPPHPCSRTVPTPPWPGFLLLNDFSFLPSLMAPPSFSKVSTMEAPDWRPSLLYVIYALQLSDYIQPAASSLSEGWQFPHGISISEISPEIQRRFVALMFLPGYLRSLKWIMYETNVWILPPPPTSPVSENDTIIHLISQGYLCLLSVHILFIQPIGKVYQFNSEYSTFWDHCLRWHSSVQFSSVQSLSRVRLFVTPWITARQAYKPWPNAYPLSLE